MADYRMKAPVDAIQVIRTDGATGHLATNEIPAWLAAEMSIGRIEPIPSLMVYKVETDACNTIARLGDWIVRDKLGSLHVFHKDAFPMLFEKCQGAPIDA